MAFENAILYIEPKNKGDKWEKLPVQYNPSQLTIDRGATYSEKAAPGLDTPIQQYTSGQAKKMSLDLVFDTYEPPSLANGGVEGGTSVTEITFKLEQTLKIVAGLHRPPLVEFCWGDIWFKGIVTELKQQYTMFLEDGTPVRAKVTLSLKSTEDVLAIKKKKPLESPDRTKIHTLCQGEYLWYLAWKEYGDPELWREIAKANKIRDPLKVSPGQEIIIPAL